jgi:hypothetical protein
MQTHLMPVVLLAALTAAPAAAQVVPEYIAPAADTQPTYRWQVRWTVVGATVGATAGWFLGFLGGAVAGGNCQGDYCVLGYMAMGALVGETLGTGLGAHLGNGGRGHPLASVAAVSALTGLAALLFYENTDPAQLSIFLPLVQLPVAVLVESLSGRARFRPWK